MNICQLESLQTKYRRTSITSGKLVQRDVIVPYPILQTFRSWKCKKCGEIRALEEDPSI